MPCTLWPHRLPCRAVRVRSTSKRQRHRDAASSDLLLDALTAGLAMLDPSDMEVLPGLGSPGGLLASIAAVLFAIAGDWKAGNGVAEVALGVVPCKARGFAD
mmetsp:Transcript_112118/g.272335  ORF Transcript_112118/g.272335 Transcript_112118/m.272335 type:complete len:102 (+) Transcript_112118:746-1051(+)